jgi:hypothetical protein
MLPYYKFREVVANNYKWRVPEELIFEKNNERLIIKQECFSDPKFKHTNKLKNNKYYKSTNIQDL